MINTAAKAPGTPSPHGSSEPDPRPGRPRSTSPDVTVSLPRLYLLRSAYLLMGVGLALTEWPLLLRHEGPWPLMDGVVVCMLVALSLLAFLGLRYPLQMVPLLLFELAWKILWMTAVALPARVGGWLDAATVSVFYSCALVVVVAAVIPWRWVSAQFVSKRGDRWRPAGCLTDRPERGRDGGRRGGSRTGVRQRVRRAGP